MEISFSFWSWLGLASNLATIAVSLGIVLVMLGTLRWHRPDVWLLVFLLTLCGQVAGGQLTNVLFWLKEGDPLVSFWISLSFFVANGVALFAFTGSLLRLQRRLYRTALVVGAVGWLAASSMLFLGQAITEVWLNETGLLRYHITAQAYSLSLLPFVYQTASLGLLIYFRHRLVHRWVIFGVAALLAGPLLNLLGINRWLGVSIPFTALSPFIGVSIIGYALARRQIFDPLARLTFNLEHEVAERTRQLEAAGEELRLANEALNRRAGQLDTTVGITREVASIGDLERLLQRAVDLTHARLGYSHVSLYLIDSQRQGVVRQAAAGQVDHLARSEANPALEMALQSVTANGQPRLLLGSNAPYEDFVEGGGADDLPPSRTSPPGLDAALILPLRVESQIIGAIEFQSDRGIFSGEETAVLQILADHLAAAIENARQLRRTQAQIEELMSLQRRYSQQVWHELPDNLALMYRHDKLETGVSAVQALKDQGIAIPPSGTSPPWGTSPSSRTSQGFLSDTEALQAAERTDLLSVPVRLRGQVIGFLGLRKSSEEEDWSANEKMLVEAVASQMALALENAQLVQEAQRLATREQQINLISARARGSVSLDAILQNTVRELGKALNVSRAFIQIGLEEPENLTPDAL